MAAVLSLDEDAARALDVARREGRELRFTLLEHCHTGRYRLAVRYRVTDPDGRERDVNLGLLWSEDRESLDALRARLEAGAARR
jgi:hypothetical protein